ncbi:hypothetical protein AB1E18_004743 [Capra hircus]
MRNAGLEEVQAGIKIARRNINNLRYADDTTLMAESEEKLNSLLMKVKEESEKVGLELNFQKMKIMTSGPITSWQIDRETVETVPDFIFLGSKITADDADTTSDTVGDEWCVTAVSPLRLSDSERESSKYKSQESRTALSSSPFPKENSLDRGNTAMGVQFLSICGLLATMDEKAVFAHEELTV